MTKININDCSTVEIPIDEIAKILFYKDRILRIISEAYIDSTQLMIDSGLFNELMEKKLFPKTWISDVEIEGYSMIIEHEKINHWNYPYEWSFDMLKDAALTVIEVNKIANKYGYQIRDGHSYNIVFNMSKAQYIDFGSFVKIDSEIKNSWISYELYYKYFYIPLYLWTKGFPDTARNIFLMMDDFSELEFYKIKHPFLSCIGRNFFFKGLKNIRTISLVSRSKIIAKFNNSIKGKVVLIINFLFKNYFTSIKLEKKTINLLKPKEISMWDDYHNNVDPASDVRFIKIKEIIQNLQDASSLVELASNQGKFAEFVLDSTHIEKVIATDYDKEAINIMYNNNKHRDNFLPLLFDMVRTNGRQYDEYIHDRVKSDIVVALAVTHHLLLTQSIPIEYILKTMSKLTNKYIIIEFMPLGLYSGNIHNIQPVPSFYTLKWFRENFVQYFDLILDKELEINRHVFVGKLK